ncbi:FKBP-type peptidyl-prolyl cis-trans isomerase [Alcanivorax quisquiliarum]|uniref:Peptidyl-prolyl cis-trans isomerase n=1 Tax=Alcanivorax quisquiliarum TaxID=2933565 RepID=A0ABT0E676_9GAMM|nr:peptidylprolyl isomerase [Alcanivorax quisquiliarum]MCK0537228.1 peptidylprolyl isomerase [Alcanivorax quisquiliarum]
MQIAENAVVAIHYTLTNDAGDTLDSSRERDEPLAYLHGHGNIIPGLEKALLGKQSGDTLKVTVEPAEGYGERHEGLIQEVPREAFQGVDELEPGMQFQASTDAGPRMFTITDVQDDVVTVDGNHPLAGATLHFDVEVADVRAASAEELSHGHVHGPGGHEH